MKKDESAKDLLYYLSLPYTIRLRPDDEGDFVATVEELKGCMAHAPTAEEAIANLREHQQLWIEDCLQSGEPVPLPDENEDLPSGKWLQRVPRTIHKRLTDLARKEEVSLNQLVLSILSEALSLRTAHSEAPSNSPKDRKSARIWDVWQDPGLWDREKDPLRKGAIGLKFIEQIDRMVYEYTKTDDKEDDDTHASHQRLH